jgi:Raf kinase inhibitor-like YbhB/YbcL family protein
VALVVATMILPALGACGGGDEHGARLPDAAATIRVTSTAFDDGAAIPRVFTCDGAGTSPPLAWSGVSSRARELALVVEDPDADRFLHWTVLKLAPSTSGLSAGHVPAGAVETKNGFGKSGWGGPCPPKGDDAHHYVFSLYALDAPLGLGADASADAVGKAITAHALARGELVGTYARQDG